VPADAPVPVKVLSPLLKRQITEAQLITRAAGYKGLPLRVLGSAGVALHCREARQWMLAPSHNVLELAARSNMTSILNEILESVGYVPLVKFNESTGGKRLIYRKAESELWADIHCGAYEMYHRVEFDAVLTDEELVLPATQTFLTRLQTVEANDADLRDLIALLCDHEVSVGTSPDAIDGTQSPRCAEDWGWYAPRCATWILRFDSGRAPPAPHLRVARRPASIDRAAPKACAGALAGRGSMRWYKTALPARGRQRICAEPAATRGRRRFPYARPIIPFPRAVAWRTRDLNGLAERADRLWYNPQVVKE
jgi:hypothetical protein